MAGAFRMHKTEQKNIRGALAIPVLYLCITPTDCLAFSSLIKCRNGCPPGSACFRGDTCPAL